MNTCAETQSNEIKNTYRTRLGDSIDTVRILIHQALAFCGHDETKNSKNRGNFLALLQWLANYNEEINKLS